MNAGNLKTSDRLRKTLSVLKEGWHTTWEISQATQSMAVHSDVAALRANGVSVESERMKGTDGRIWRYKIAV